MLMYAWSPNWKANSVGNDHYNLYVRRSFDGGQTWTTSRTTPTSSGMSDHRGRWHHYLRGLRRGGRRRGGDLHRFTYEAGDFEQARNVSQLIGNKITVLDPRYSPTGGTKNLPNLSVPTGWTETG